ncbi:hypothetical protein [Comamonas terrigena]|uniref:hypothetical protein n=1 Tax=Comamonas terrigena TaxID=32013 RepID=UPI000A8B1786|nr:hypothetical protein [Comamonas terrigena]BBL22683.1 hypothetical protein CT3_01380 [Comamonas terrigena NBRC 13299]SUY92362.1 Uncharacterised protein [Comamonas terrigena]
MNEYSESWLHLKALIGSYGRGDLNVKAPSYKDQRHARALSVFLINAELATPRLNRKTVKAILEGGFQWPQVGGTKYLGTDIPLSRFEQLGLVSFYADWCAIHASSVNDESAIDPTLIPVIRTIEHLRDIKLGRNGYLRPHYACGERELRKLLQIEFGDCFLIEEILPELELECGKFRLIPGNQNFSIEISTQLWNDLRDYHEPEDAFIRWIMFFCVNCDRVMPVVFDGDQYKERIEFNEQLLKFLAKDTDLCASLDCYGRQSINEESFAYLIRPTEENIQIYIDLNGERSTSTTPEQALSRPSLSSLEDIYPSPLGEASSALEFVIHSKNMRIRGREFFYSWLVSNVVEASVRIEIAHLASSGLVEKLVDMANDKRPVLKYLLYFILPNYELPKYMLLLLAGNKTSDVAFFHLSTRSFDRSQGPGTAHIQCLENGYQQLLCHEYVQAIQNRPDFSSRFIAVVTMLGERCILHSPDFFKEIGYRLLLTILESLADKQVTEIAQRFAETRFDEDVFSCEKTCLHCRYLVGFWLIDRLKKTGADPSETIRDAVRESLREQYKKEFVSNLKGMKSLAPSSFFSTLSWKQIFIGVGQDFMLELSIECNEWAQSLVHKDEKSVAVADAIRHYLQILMHVGRTSVEISVKQAVASRVMEIIWLCGFKDRKRYVQIFEGPRSGNFDLWKQVCIYSNSVSDVMYEDFIKRCAPHMPLTHLFALLERTPVIARQNLLQNAIEKHCENTDYGIDMEAMEVAFNAAINLGQTEIASRIISSAKKIISQDRFTKSTNSYLVRIRKIWQSYEYKFHLLMLYEEHKEDPLKFEELAKTYQIPHESHFDSEDKVHHDDCRIFRRQITATAFSDSKPAKTISYMKQLYMETKREHHGFLILYGHVKLFAREKKKTDLKNALATFLATSGKGHPDQMKDYWVATVLEAYQLSGAEGVDGFWAQLSAEQQEHIRIFTPYCRALLARGDSFTVQKILARYREINHASLEKLEIEDLVSELTSIEKDGSSIKGFLSIMAEKSQRTDEQLQKHYNQIIAKDFAGYVAVVKPSQAVHEYLRDAMLAIANELTLRKRNLQEEGKDEKGKFSFKGIKLENLVNDWFVSLFDQRMSHAKLSLRDQKRGGHSASGKGPGEIDGFITSSDGSRVGIFEAFRLLSFDTTTIRGHLNKIAGYDGESLSPVVIVGYCDVTDFSKLVESYKSYVSTLSYKGYMPLEGALGELTVSHDFEHVWLGSETRRRGRKDIVFYHLLINLHFSPPVAATGSDGLCYAGT